MVRKKKTRSNKAQKGKYLEFNIKHLTALSSKVLGSHLPLCIAPIIAN